MSGVKHFLEISDLDADELNHVLELAKSCNEKPLANKSVALLFEKPSLRTRHSCETAIFQLGGLSVYTRPEELELNGRESTEDIGRCLSEYHCAIAARTYDHSTLEKMASSSRSPVINLLSNDTHPVQTLADLLTIKQHFGEIKNKTICFVGDPNNVALPLAIGAQMLGANFIMVHPEKYQFNSYANLMLDKTGTEIQFSNDPKSAVKNADVIYTDAWFSMGQEDEKLTRYKDFVNFQINDELMGRAKDTTIFMHCLPAHRDSEVTSSVLDSSASVVFQQAQNRMHSIKGLFAYLVGNNVG